MLLAFMARNAARSWQTGGTLSDSRRYADLDPDLGDLAGLGGGESRRAPLTGIRALMLAVLDNGIAGYLSTIATLRAEAEVWVTSPSRRSPFSFVVVCEALGLEGPAVRAALLRWRAARLPSSRRTERRRPNVSRAGRVVVTKPR